MPLQSAHRFGESAGLRVFRRRPTPRKELQAAVCTFVSEMKQGGETGEGVVASGAGLVREVGARSPSSERTQFSPRDMVTWCLAEYYRESA